MIICPRCGQSNDAAARFCSRCGNYIEQAGGTAEPAPAAPSQREDAPPAVVAAVSLFRRASRRRGSRPWDPSTGRNQSAARRAGIRCYPRAGQRPRPGPPLSGGERKGSFCSRWGTSNPADRA